MRKETDVQRAICEYLQIKGYFFWREGNQRRVKDGRHFKSKYEVNGKPDIFVFVGAITFALEVKTLKGRISTSQKYFEQEWEFRPTRQYFVVKSVDDVIKIGL